MKLEDIVKEWEKDSVIDETNIKSATLSTPLLHSKYLTILASWKSQKTITDIKLKEMIRLKTRYYRGELTREELTEYGWNQYQFVKPLKSELEQILSADPDVNKIQNKVSAIDSIIYVLESIMKQISSRDFEISNYLKYQAFINGVK